MNFLGSISANAADVMSFGPAVLLRHLARLRKDRIAVLNVKGFGKVHIRHGQSDMFVMRQVFSTLDYDFPAEVEQRIRKRQRSITEQGKTPVIIDAGANIGVASLWFAAKFPEAVVVAVEPDPGNLLMLHRNAGPRVRVLEAAIGAEPGFVSLSNQEVGWAVRTERATSGIRVMSVDEIIATVPNGELLITKIDIEGFESDLFAKNTGWLDHVCAVFLEPHEWMLPKERSSRSFQRAFAQHEFDLFIRGENLLYVRAASVAVPEEVSAA